MKTEFDLSKIRQFEELHGIGLKRDRFPTYDLAFEYSKLLKELWGASYDLEEIKQDDQGYYQQPVEQIQ